MDKIENINNLTLAQLIEIWEICNGAEDCQKCPLNDKSCAKILHTATLEALKNLVQLVDFQKEEIEDFKRLTTIQRGRKYYNKFVTEVFQKERNNDLIYPDFDEIYKRYFEQKAEIDDYKQDTIPRLQDALNRANKYGMDADKEINRLDTALKLALKLNAELEADKRLANVELNRLNSEVVRLESDCKTLSAVLSRGVESDKEAVSAFIGFLEEHAKTEVFKRCGLDLELKFVYIDDIKRLEKEFWEGDNK